jgi:Fe-S oxidoreductase
MAADYPRIERCDAESIVSGKRERVATRAGTPSLLDDPTWLAGRIGRAGDRLHVLRRFGDLPAGSLAHAKRRVVAYHDSCQGLNALGIHEAPRRILGEVLGHEVRNLSESRVCCGFGGSFSFDYPRISERLMNRKLDDVEATGALEIVTDNQGCILQLRGGSDAQGRPLQVLHLAQLVAEGVDAARERLEAVERNSLPESN